MIVIVDLAPQLRTSKRTSLLAVTVQSILNSLQQVISTEGPACHGLVWTQMERGSKMGYNYKDIP